MSIKGLNQYHWSLVVLLIPLMHHPWTALVMGEQLVSIHCERHYCNCQTKQRDPNLTHTHPWARQLCSNLKRARLMTFPKRWTTLCTTNRRKLPASLKVDTMSAKIIPVHSHLSQQYPRQLWLFCPTMPFKPQSTSSITLFLTPHAPTLAPALATVTTAMALCWRQKKHMSMVSAGSTTQSTKRGMRQRYKWNASSCDGMDVVPCVRACCVLLA